MEVMIHVKISCFQVCGQRVSSNSEYLQDSSPSADAHLKLVPREGRVRRAESQDINDAASSPRPHTLILVGKQMSTGKFLGDLAQRFFVNLFLFELAQFLGETLEAFE
jgi:hypothetical protein